jgi:predicted lipoprotein with Yx(FWY)xxD motif
VDSRRALLALSGAAGLAFVALVVVLFASRGTENTALAASAAPAASTLTLTESPYGAILFDGDGRALYAFTADPRGRSVCEGACAEAWPPYRLEGPLRHGPETERMLLGTIERPDGSRQVTYAGRPLYYYVGDTEPGQVLCQNVEEFGGTWLVVRASGRLVRPA